MNDFILYTQNFQHIGSKVHRIGDYLIVMGLQELLFQLHPVLYNTGCTTSLYNIFKNILFIYLFFFLFLSLEPGNMFSIPQHVEEAVPRLCHAIIVHLKRNQVGIFIRNFEWWEGWSMGKAQKPGLKKKLEMITTQEDFSQSNCYIH